MSQEALRIITANVYKNQAFSDPESLAWLMRSDGVPTVVALQEATEDIAQTVEVIKAHNYQPLLLATHGLAFALSPEVTVQDAQEVTYPRRGRTRAWGMHVVYVTVGGRELVAANGHAPVAMSSYWDTAAYRDALAMGRLVRQYSHSTVAQLGDHNHVTERQRQLFRSLQATWDGMPLVAASQPTYQMHQGKHAWLGQLGIEGVQLDGIAVRVPEDTAGDLRYQTVVAPICSDHMAVEVTLLDSEEFKDAVDKKAWPDNRL